MSDVSLLACVPLRSCLPPPLLEADISLSVEDDSLVLACSKHNHVLNLLSLNYPETVEAACTQNYILNGTLPFWSLGSGEFPAGGKKICLSSEECQDVPFISEDLVNTWTGHTELGTTVTFFCNVDDTRGRGRGNFLGVFQISSRLKRILNRELWEFSCRIFK